MENKLFLFFILFFLLLYTCGRKCHQLGPNKEQMINGDPEAEQTHLCPRSILGVEFFLNCFISLNRISILHTMYITTDGWFKNKTANLLFICGRRRRHFSVLTYVFSSLSTYYIFLFQLCFMLPQFVGAQINNCTGRGRVPRMWE